MMKNTLFLGIVLVGIHAFAQATQIQRPPFALATKYVLSLPPQDLLFKENQEHYKRGLINALKHRNNTITEYCEVLYKQKEVRKKRCSGCPCLKEYVKALGASEKVLKCFGFDRAHKTSKYLYQEFREQYAKGRGSMLGNCGCLEVPCQFVDLTFQSVQMLFPVVKKFWWPCLTDKACDSYEKQCKYIEIKNFLQTYGAAFFEKYGK